MRRYKIRPLAIFYWLLPCVVLLAAGCRQHHVSHRGEKKPIPGLASFQRPKVALVLGGGGTKGIAHVGVLYELQKAGICPDLIVGCSSGAIVGALYCDNPDSSRLKELFIDLKRSDLIDFSFFASRFGMVKGVSLRNFLEAHLTAASFPLLKIPLIVVTTDMMTGELVELGGGALVPALQASSAIPGVFKPVAYLGRLFIDGGVINPVPVEIARKHGANLVIAVDVGEKPGGRDYPRHLLGVIRRGLEITHRILSDYSARSADVLIRMDFQNMGMFSDQFNEELYEKGREMAREKIPLIKTLMSQVQTSQADEKSRLP